MAHARHRGTARDRKRLLVPGGPVHGRVIRYSCLWLWEHREGREEGTKDRPCAIVLASHLHDGETQVLVVPVSHGPPENFADALDLPPAVKQHLGLDSGSCRLLTEQHPSPPGMTLGCGFDPYRSPAAHCNNAAIVDALADPAVRSRFADLGFETPSRDEQTPEALSAFRRARNPHRHITEHMRVTR